jgi:hypothetical protein
MEGYFWRFTDPRSGRVLIALNGVNRGPRGHWATLGVAAHPSGFLRTVAHPEGRASTAGLGAFAGAAFSGTADRLRVDLDNASLDVRIADPVRQQHHLAAAADGIEARNPALRRPVVGATLNRQYESAFAHARAIVFDDLVNGGNLRVLQRANAARNAN